MTVSRARLNMLPSILPTLGTDQERLDLVAEYKNEITVEDFNRLLQFIAPMHQAKFLELFSPDLLLEFIGHYRARGGMAALLEQGMQFPRDATPFIGLDINAQLAKQLNFHLAIKRLAHTCAQHEYPVDAYLYLKASGANVARAFKEASESGSLSSKEMQQLRAVALLTRSIIQSRRESLPYTTQLLTNLTLDPIRLGEKRIERIVVGAIFAFIFAAIAATSIALALISFGVLAPLAIATITLGTNMLIAALATTAAPVALSIATASTLWAVSGREQGPALAVDQFVAVMPKSPAPSIR